MPTDEDDHDDNFLFNHPERGGLCCRLGAHSHCYHCLDPTPPIEGGGQRNASNSGDKSADPGVSGDDRSQSRQRASGRRCPSITELSG